MKILVTGCAGFIGFHLCKLLLSRNFQIYGLDNLNSYYDIKLKNNRLLILKKYKNFHFVKKDINSKSIISYYKKKRIEVVVHLAAQAGVRYSIKNPRTYIDTNLNGFFNILELSRLIKVKHLILASSSSVYGISKKFPLKENFNTDYPVSLYAATKKSNEVLAYSYSKIFNLPITCLRFFTVYGPYGRPDMSLFKFTKSILSKKKIELYNNGNHERDFTYIDDAVNMTAKLIHKPPRLKVPYNIYNVCSSKPIKLVNYLNILKENLNLNIKVKKIPLQKGDVFKTHGSNTKILSITGKITFNNMKFGIKEFTKWFKSFYRQNYK